MKASSTILHIFVQHFMFNLSWWVQLLVIVLIATAVLTSKLSARAFKSLMNTQT